MPAKNDVKGFLSYVDETCLLAKPAAERARVDLRFGLSVTLERFELLATDELRNELQRRCSGKVELEVDKADNRVWCVLMYNIWG